ncbi:tRNA methyltransferase roswell [Nomia melanderi]|uniref:tRNA methyltransferase roswell n=1 Tax=Nomia melanderi TaxID=2448451 RepID=UPI0013042356|nr:mitochondrial ribonuclease P protein 1 homolog [Nomia melanderi]XP_031827767.1 mitochondrial ribonuclease P protein 1 homolog [Nomia melanderi]
MYNAVRCITIMRKCNINSMIYSIQYKIINSVFAYLKPTCYNNCNISIVRPYSGSPSSKEVTNYYKEKNKEKLQQLLKDPNKLKIYNKLKLELEQLQHTHGAVPSEITELDWIKLISASTKAQRRKCLMYRWKTEMSKLNEEKKKELKNYVSTQRYLSIKKKEEENVNHRIYGLNRNALFLRISRTAMNSFYHKRLLNAMLFDEAKIVFDLGYDEHMTTVEAQNCGKQLIMSFSLNRFHPEPFNLYFCNVNKESFTMQFVHKGIPTLYEDDFPLHVTEKSYLDLFNPQDIVYLTPNAKHTLQKFDPTKVYIIGAIVDKGTSKPLSLLSAKQAHVQVYRLPLSEKVEWGSGSGKTLPLNQVLSILLDLRHTNSWSKALEHVPRRKLKQQRLAYMLKRINSRKHRLQSMNRHVENTEYD